MNLLKFIIFQVITIIVPFLTFKFQFGQWETSKLALLSFQHCSLHLCFLVTCGISGPFYSVSVCVCVYIRQEC